MNPLAAIVTTLSAIPRAMADIPRTRRLAKTNASNEALDVPSTTNMASRVSDPVRAKPKRKAPATPTASRPGRRHRWAETRVSDPPRISE